MGRDFTAVFTASLVLLLCPRPGAFVPSVRARGGLLGASSANRRVLDASLVAARPRCRSNLPRTYSSAQQQANSDQGSSEHDGRGSDQNHDANRPAPRRPPPPLPPPSAPADQEAGSVVLFRVLRGGGNPGNGDDGRSGAATTSATIAPVEDLVEVSLDDQAGGEGGKKGDGLANTAQSLRDFLFLVRSSQPGSIGEELQRRGVRVWPEEAFVDCGVGVGGGEAHSAPAVEVRAGDEGWSSGGDEQPGRFGWTGGIPLPLDTPMAELPRDKNGLVRLVLWDPCGPDHPLMRAVGGNPPEEASIEVLNFVLPSSGANAGEGADGGDGRVDAEGKGGGGCTSGYGNDFHESRSAVVFRKWFTEEQQQVIADALAAQMFSEDDGEGPGHAVDREHFPLLKNRAALAAVGDSMLSALSSERFSGMVGGRDPPVPTRANREFNAVCYGAEAKMQEHRDTWKEWTLIVSIGNTIPFDLGSAQGSPDIRLELSSGEGLLFNGYELFHRVHRVKPGTAPSFWASHALSTQGGFARVGFLSMKSFNSKGVSAPTWGPETRSPHAAKLDTQK